MEILLDTSFIITAAKQGIDFEAVLNGMTDEEVKWIIPQEVLGEIRGLMHANKLKKVELQAIDVALELLQKLDARILNISDTASDVDTKIVNYIKGTHIVLATLDKGLKSRVDNRILSVRGKNHLILS